MTIQGTKPRTRRKAVIHLIEFLRPDGYWPTPYTVEMAFQVLRWLITSASGGGYVTRHQWHDTCAVGLMGGVGAVNGGCRPIRSLENLSKRFHWAILGSDRYHPEVARWRADKGIHANAVLEMGIRHYSPLRAPPAHLPWRCQRDVENAITWLLEETVGQKLVVQLNPAHKGARVVHYVGILVGPNGFEFRLHYGFKSPKVDQFDSDWSYTMAESEGDEPFLDTLARAISEFNRLSGKITADDDARSVA